MIFQTPFIVGEFYQSIMPKLQNNKHTIKLANSIGRYTQALKTTEIGVWLSPILQFQCA